MYRIIIIDDDIWIRTEIKNKYDLDKNGYSIVGEASDGEKGLRLALELKPDIVITDMNMPNMNGIKLIERLNTVTPDIQVIVISNYDDFEYVRKSLKLNASDYLLKHNLSKEVFIEALEKCVSLINNKKALSAKADQTVVSGDPNIKTQKKLFLQKLLSGQPVPIDEAWKEEKNSDVGYVMVNSRLLILEIDNFQAFEKRYNDHELNSRMNTLMSLIENIIDKTKDNIIDYQNKGRFVLLLSFKDVFSQMQIFEMTADIIDTIRYNLKKYMNLTACYAAGAICQRADQICSNYQELAENLKQKFYTGPDSVLSSEWKPASKVSIITLDQKSESEIFETLSEKNETACLELIKKLYKNLMDNAADPISCRIISMELISIAKKYLLANRINVELIEESDELWNSIFNDGTLQDMEFIVIKLYQAVFLEVKNNLDRNKYSRHTLNAINYIKKNYMNPIGLTDVAESIAVNKSYLSRVFREDLGLGFSEYLNKYRVKQAQKLIQEGQLPIKEIARGVGFNHETYFFKVFKQITGETPQTFEKDINITSVKL